MQATKYGDSYIVYNVWKIIYRVQCKETDIEGTMHVTNIGGTMYGDSNRGYNVSSVIYRVQCMEAHLEGTMYGDSYRGYYLWRFI